MSLPGFFSYLNKLDPYLGLESSWLGVYRHQCKVEQEFLVIEEDNRGMGASQPYKIAMMARGSKMKVHGATWFEIVWQVKY